MENIILRTSNLMKTYGGDGTYVNAVNRINLRIRRGELTAIVGASGSGKSTLLHLMGGIDDPSGGSVYVRLDETSREEADLYAITPNALAKFRGQNFGFVFQNYALLPVLTAWENVMIPSIYSGADFDSEYASNLFIRLGLSERVNHLPSEMSGGEQQRVALIRALIGRPKILFADEPTGNLDRKNGEELLELLTSLTRDEKCTVIMVTHDSAIADRADTVIRMRDGEIVV